MKIYVLHCKTLVERKKHIINELGKHNLTYEFYEKYDKNELSKEDLLKFNPKLRETEKSLLMKHLNVYEEIINKNIPITLIFEDDVFLENDFNNKLNKYMKELPNDWDMLFIGNGCNLHIKDLVPNKFIYKKEHKNGATRCTDSYLITQKCAKKIIDFVNSHSKLPYINKPVDLWLNDVLKTLNINVYWCEPTIVSQGTQKQNNEKIKRFESSIKT